MPEERSWRSITRLQARGRAVKIRAEELETALFEAKEELLREAKRRQKTEAGARSQGLALEKAALLQTDVDDELGRLTSSKQAVEAELLRTRQLRERRGFLQADLRTHLQ